MGGSGLSGEVAVLGDHAYVGSGTNGGFAAQWNKTPRCDAATNTVKVVSLADPAKPAVVSTITLPGTTLPRAVAAIRVKPIGAMNVFTGDLLAVALESCNADAAGLVGVQFYDVSNPAAPVLRGFDNRFVGNTATRDVSLVQRPDGRVLAFEANQGGGGGGIQAVDVTNPTTPTSLGRYSTDNGKITTQGCRPFSFANGVAVNATGTRAYAAYQDQGVLTLDASDAATGLPRLGQALYAPSEEGNSLRFVPNAAETAALATDEDLLPARTTLTIGQGAAAGSYVGCEVIWGAPLYRRAVPSLENRRIVVVPNNGCSAADFAGVTSGDLALVDRGGRTPCNGFSFDQKAVLAQNAGAAAILVANTTAGQLFFSPDSEGPGDAGVRIPVVLLASAAAAAIKAAAPQGPTVGTLADTAETWGALRIFGLTGSDPVQTAIFNAPHTNTLTPGDGLYHAVDAVWEGDRALVAWMSDGLRVVDVADRSAPKAGPFYVPPAVADPTGNYPTVPLVASAAAFGPRRVVISDVNSGLYVLSLDSPGSEAPGDGSTTPGGGAPPPPTAPGDGSAPPSAGGGSGLPGTPTTPNSGCNKFTSKLSLARATFNRADRTISILAPITRLASGSVQITLFAARTRLTFNAKIDSRNGRIRVTRRITAAQALLGTGILTIRYGGDSDTRPQNVRLRAANNQARLSVTRPTITSNGFLRASGRVTSRARGVVRVQLEYVNRSDGQTVTLERAAKISKGRWSLNSKLSPSIRTQIARRCGTVHSYTLFTGYFPLRIRGEQRSLQVLPSR